MVSKSLLDFQFFRFFRLKNLPPFLRNTCSWKKLDPKIISWSSHEVTMWKPWNRRVPGVFPIATVWSPYFYFQRFVRPLFEIDIVLGFQNRRKLQKIGQKSDSFLMIFEQMLVLLLYRSPWPIMKLQACIPVWAPMWRAHLLFHAKHLFSSYLADF